MDRRKTIQRLLGQWYLNKFFRIIALSLVVKIVFYGRYPSILIIKRTSIIQLFVTSITSILNAVWLIKCKWIITIITIATNAFTKITIILITLIATAITYKFFTLKYVSANFIFKLIKHLLVIVHLVIIASKWSIIVATAITILNTIVIVASFINITTIKLIFILIIIPLINIAIIIVAIIIVAIIIINTLNRSL